eukprot:scaffold81767_cov57-Phaeocystis_antarctica.AAC.2
MQGVCLQPASTKRKARRRAPAASQSKEPGTMLCWCRTKKAWAISSVYGARGSPNFSAPGGAARGSCSLRCAPLVVCERAIVRPQGSAAAAATLRQARASSLC